MRPSRKRAIQSARKGEKNMKNVKQIFENTEDFIKETYKMLQAVGEAHPQGKNPVADQNIAVLIVEAAVKEGQRPEGCPVGYNLSRFVELVSLENALRSNGSHL